MSYQFIKEKLRQNAWILMSSEAKPNFKLSFNKGYTLNGFAEKVYHLHVRFWGDWDELYFKNYLIAYPVIARQYEKLKFESKEKYEQDRDAYTNAKSDFITKHSQIAREEFQNRYGLSEFAAKMNQE